MSSRSPNIPITSLDALSFGTYQNFLLITIHFPDVMIPHLSNSTFSPLIATFIQHLDNVSNLFYVPFTDFLWKGRIHVHNLLMAISPNQIRLTVFCFLLIFYIHLILVCSIYPITTIVCGNSLSHIKFVFITSVEQVP